ncbi:hypothetical protein GYMLUDRAFT_835366 [Collybiopsis luxurians FD-317 M1]|uniref:Uncharacterized protein n=1 Tax=Collybiopsis luxurians FD-317 M1 TaxID=944289 RepID=A0A0D0CKN9_9AGAR|nr:hypothetical protein GYMLUDRAFT_835366 [Collybiopsis luxurians FD-317 M1]
MDMGSHAQALRMNLFFQSTSLPLSIGTLLYFVNRYLPAIDTVLMNIILELKSSTFTPDQCKRWIQSTAWLMFAGVVVSEFILTMRTAAMWHRNLPVHLTFGCLIIIFLVPAIVLMHEEMSSLESFWHLIAMFTAIQAYNHIRSTTSSWVLKLYTEGLLFYAYMLAFSIINANLGFRTTS